MNENSRPRRNIKTLIIEPFRQLRIGFHVLVLSLIFVAVAVSLVAVAFYQQYEHVMQIFSVVDPEAKWALVTNDIFFNNALILVAVTLIYIVSLFFVVFRMTHRVYGPLVAIERFIGKISDGQYDERLKIRNKDELQRLTNCLNIMTEELEKHHGSNRKAS